jgi:hypothetical protein
MSGEKHRPGAEARSLGMRRETTTQTLNRETWR